MHFVGKGKEAPGAVRVVGGHQVRFGRFALVVGLTALMGAVLLACGQCSRAAFEKEVAASSGAQGNTLEIVMACEGWTEENVEVGVFISGDASDGRPVDEQLMFQGSSSQTIQLDAGRYEVVPQLPQLMLADGTVLEAGEPTVYCPKASSDAAAIATITYLAADANTLDDEELSIIATASFLDNETALCALARSKEKSVL